jgi:hypothetical protein
MTASTSSGPHDQRSRRSAWRLFIVFQCLYALTSSGNAFRLPDEYSTYYQVERLVDAGDLSIPQTIPRQQFFGQIGLDGKPYAPWGPLTAVLAVPFHLAGRAVAWVAGMPRETNPEVWTFLVSGITMLSTSTAAALAVAGFYRAALLLGATSSNAWRLSLMLGGASVLWTYGTNLFSEAWQAAAFTWAAVCLLEKRIPLAATLVAVAGLTKFTSLIFAPALVAAVLVDRATPLRARVQAALVLGVGIAAAFGVHGAWNMYRFGNPLDFGYNWIETVPQLPPRVFLLSDLPRGLVVLLFSPGKSILLWAPVLWFAIRRFRESTRPVQAGALVGLGLGLVFFGSYIYPEGGYSHGPRQLVPIIPLLLLPAAASRRPLERPAVITCAVVGAVMAVLSVSVSYLQDQSLGRDLSDANYYERITPPPGRAWNRYRLDYIPFVRAITSGEWPDGQVGHGVDFFPLHVARARATIPQARAIPAWLPWALPAVWIVALVGICFWRRPDGPSAQPGPISVGL